MWMQTPNNRTRCDNVLAELAQVRNVVLFPLSPQKPYDENHCIVILSLKLVEDLRLHSLHAVPCFCLRTRILMKHNLLSEKLLDNCLLITFAYVRDLADDSLPLDLLLLGANTPLKVLSHAAVVEQLSLYFGYVEFHWDETSLSRRVIWYYYDESFF